ncbi:glycosyltransferase family 2 protein [Vibrio breoganii]
MNQKISIITVNYNNRCGLIETINSVLSQTYENIEFVIVDGASTDGSVDALLGYNDERITFISEKDFGIYDAMNKGISLASGDWLVFMNSGDQFYNNSVIETVVNNPNVMNDSVKLLYGDKVLDGVVYPALDLSKNIETGGMFACHQSMFFRPNIKYNLSYKIYGDYDLLARIYKSYGPNSFYYLDMTICQIEGGGISSKVSYLKRKEKILSLITNFGLRGLSLFLKHTIRVKWNRQ